jgi:hypothetical protein
MLSIVGTNRDEAHLRNPAIRGYNVVYRADKVNHCPGCGRSHWYVGRLMAECGFCATALPLAAASLRGSGHSRSFRPVWDVGHAA